MISSQQILSIKLIQTLVERRFEESTDAEFSKSSPLGFLRLRPRFGVRFFEKDSAISTSIDNTACKGATQNKTTQIAQKCCEV